MTRWRKRKWFTALSVAQRILMTHKYAHNAAHLCTQWGRASSKSEWKVNALVLAGAESHIDESNKNASGFPEEARSLA
jgi:hypothetical protein